MDYKISLRIWSSIEVHVIQTFLRNQNKYGDKKERKMEAEQKSKSSETKEKNI